MDVDDLERHLEEEGISRQRRSPKVNGAGSSQGYDLAADLSMSDATPSASPSPEPQKAAKSVRPNKSSFVPSLTMGGYISGSGSDIDDIDIAPKKNRRGQRARQQIWEKKFGGKAKHLEKQDKDQGWDPKRGATDGGGRGARGRGGSRGGRGASSTARSARPGGRGPQSSGANDTAVTVRKKDDEGPLHPSWLAAKAAKDKQSAPAKFEGKKITFD